MIDIIQLFDDYNVEYSLEGVNTSEDFVNTKCVFCDDSSNHMGWHKEGDYVNCWICGRHTVEDSLMDLLNMSYAEVLGLMEEYSGSYSIFLDLNKRKKTENKKIEIPGKELQEMHRNYLIKRNFDPEYIIDKYRIKGTGFIGEWKYRIIIPIYYRNKLVSYQGRDITNKQKLRYKTLSKEEGGIDLGTVFYGLNDCREEVIGVVEGVFDRWRMGNNFVACLTSNITEEQIRILRNFKRIFFLFDNEKEAYNRAKKIAQKLNSLKIESYVIELDVKDPAVLKEEDVRYIRKEMRINELP